MENLGVTFRKIREMKGLTLKETSDDTITVSFLSKFERGESKISVERFLVLLSNLRVTLEEFIHISSWKLDFEDLMEKITTYYINNNVQGLSYLKEKEMKNFNNNENKKAYYSYYNAIMISSMIAEINDEEIDPDYINILTDYLFGIEYWGVYEIMIIGNSMSVIPNKTLDLLLRELDDKLEYFGGISEKVYILRLFLLSNAVTKFLRSRNLELANYYINKIEKTNIQDSFLTIHFNQMYSKTVLNYLTGSEEESMEKINGLLNILKTLNLETEYISYKRDFYNHYYHK